jgi:hypothetical protein
MKTRLWMSVPLLVLALIAVVITAPFRHPASAQGPLRSLDGADYATR